MRTLMVDVPTVWPRNRWAGATTIGAVRSRVTVTTTVAVSSRPPASRIVYVKLSVP